VVIGNSKCDEFSLIGIDSFVDVFDEFYIFAGHSVTMDFLKDLLKFIAARKKWWLAPVIVVLILIGVLIVIGGGSAIAPFIYTLF
jgi:hypothetical protein